MTLIRIAGVACVAWWLSLATAAAQEIYVPNYADGTVSVVDGATNSVTYTIDVPGLPEAVIISGGYAYVAMDGGTTVPVISTASHEVVHEIPVSLRADPTIHVGSGVTANRLYIPSWTTSGCPTAAGGPEWDIARSISVVDITDPFTASEIALIPVSQGVFPFSIAPAGDYAYAVSCDPIWNVIYKISLTVDPEVVDPVVASFDLSEIFAADLRVSPDPLKPFALVSAGNCILVIDLVTFTEEIGARDCSLVTPWGIQFNDDATRAWVADFGGGTINTFGITVNMSNPLDPAFTITQLSPPTAVTSGVGGMPLEIVRSGTSLYAVATAEYWVAPAEVIAFDISTDTAVQGCSLPVGNGGFQLDVLGSGVWSCGAEPPPPPARYKGKGAGHLTGSRKIHFEFHARWYKNLPKGQCNVQDDTPKKGRKIRCLDVTDIFMSGDELVVKGNALDGKTPTTYEIRATDYSKPNAKNSLDTFSITTASGFFAGPATVSKGDVRISEVKVKVKGGEDEDEDDD